MSTTRKTVSSMLNKSARARQVRNALRAPSDEEQDAKERYEEFWSDTCWTEPLEPEMDRSQIAAQMSKL